MEAWILELLLPKQVHHFLKRAERTHPANKVLSDSTMFVYCFFSKLMRNVVVLCSAPAERKERQQSPPGRAGRRRGGGDGDEFLRMLGITPDEPPKPTPKQVESADDSGK